MENRQLKIKSLCVVWFLQVNKHCIPIQSMYSLNMERILAGMWHQTEEEEAQKKVVNRWKESLKRDPPYAIRTTLTNGHR